uniref:Uncharacterized protein n=1 Tax=Arundo donax TaxID=35708 RepID=A0A0A8Z2N9_ARUDO
MHCMMYADANSNGKKRMLLIYDCKTSI